MEQGVPRMGFGRQTAGSIDYKWFRYLRSGVRFRGPAPDFDQPYIAFLGSSESFGKFVPAPFPALVGQILGVGCANFSALNAGVDMVLRDPSILLGCLNARVTVVAISGAHNLSNRYYRVHPRRNDRFVGESALLRGLYPDVDFTEVHFTRHLLSVLAGDGAKFPNVVNELRTAWLARMRTLLESIEVPVVLLWMADHRPADGAIAADAPFAGGDPLFVSRAMVDALAPLADELVEVVATDEVLHAGHRGMVLTPSEAAAAARLPGPAFHAHVAEVLAPVLAEYF